MKRKAKAALMAVCIILMIMTSGCKKSQEDPEDYSRYGYQKYGDFLCEETDHGMKLIHYLGNDKEVVIPDQIEGKKVAELNQRCFYENYTLETVYIPDTITTIVERAFQDCAYLREVSGGKNVEIIEDCAFSGCYSLEKAISSDRLRVIGECGFDECRSLKEINLPDTLESIEWSAFSGCEQLIDIDIPDSVKVIGSGALEDTRWFRNQTGNVIVGDGILVKYPLIEEGGDKDVWIPEGVKSVHLRDGDSRIQNIYIPDGVESIIAYHMDYISNTTIFIPPSVKYIGSTFEQEYDDFEPEYIGDVYLVTEEGTYAREFAREKGIYYEIADDIQAIYETTLAEHNAQQTGSTPE